jgi:hypothetical protein
LESIAAKKSKEQTEREQKQKAYLDSRQEAASNLTGDPFKDFDS